MKVEDAFQAIQRLYIETAPLIYYVEENLTYLALMDTIVGYLEDTPIEAISSVIILTEVLNQPIRLGRVDLEQAYQNILLNSNTFRLMPVTAKTAESAARLRAKYNLRTPDALHIATALETSCDAFLTNDLGLKRVQEVRVLVLDELETNPH
jgi:predicted nucleic acid-binding protein